MLVRVLIFAYRIIAILVGVSLLGLLGGCKLDDNRASGSIGSTPASSTQISYSLSLKNSAQTTNFPIEYDLVFDHEINPLSLDISAVQQTGTAQMVQWDIVPSGDNKNFTLRALSAATEGTVLPELLLSTIQDKAGSNAIPKYLESAPPAAPSEFKLYIPGLVLSPESTNFNEFRLLGSIQGYIIAGTKTNLYVIDPSNNHQITQTLPTSHLNLAGTTSGDYLIIGNSGDDIDFTNSGVIHIYKMTAGTLSFETSIKPADKEVNGAFGRELASDDLGNLLVAGKYSIGTGNFAGKIYYYKLESGSWNLKQTIFQNTTPISGYNNEFGSSLSLSGNRFITGNKSFGSTSGNYFPVGRSYIYELSGSTWSLSSSIDPPISRMNLNFASKVKIKNDEILIGSIYAGVNDETGGIFYYKLIGSTWTLQQRIKASAVNFDLTNDLLYAYHGHQVDYYHLRAGSFIKEGEIPSATTSTFLTHFGYQGLVVGNKLYVGDARFYYEGVYKGAIEYFDINPGNPTYSLKGTDIKVTRGADASVAVSLNKAAPWDVKLYWSTEDGTALAGTDYTATSGVLTIPAGQTTGNVVIPTTTLAAFKSNNTFFVKVTSIEGAHSVSTTLSNIELTQNSINGISFSSTIKASSSKMFGNYLILTDYLDDTCASNCGAVEVLSYQSGSYVSEAVLYPSDPVTDRYFGAEVSMSGDYLAIKAKNGSAWNAPGRIYVFHKVAGSWVEEDIFTANDPWNSDGFGRAIQMSDDVMLVGRGYNGTGTSPGAVYVFQRTGTTWSQVNVLEEGGSSGYANYGGGIYWDKTSNRVMVTMGGTNQLLFYTISGTTLTPMNNVTVSIPIYSASFDGTYAVVGDPYDDTVATNAGVAVIIEYNGSSWAETTTLYPSSGSFGYMFGDGVLAANNKLFIDTNNYGIHIFEKPSSSWEAMGSTNGDPVYDSMVQATLSSYSPLHGKVFLKGCFDGFVACLMNLSP